MKIVNEKPPIWDAACAAFQVNPVKTVFTYGDTLYNPAGVDINPDLLAHEEVHAEQQKHNEKDAALWWGRYLREPEFRLDQEAKAYGVQYAWFCRATKDREKLHRILYSIASILSGPLYGKCVGHVEAMALIKKHANV